MQAPGENLLLRLWETIAEKGIGSLLRPWQTRREGHAQTDVRRQELLVLAQTERDVEEIRAGRKFLGCDGMLRAFPAPSPDESGILLASPIEPDSILKAISQIANNNLIDEAIRSEVNVAKALIAAEVELETDTQSPPEQKIDDDWLYRWRDCAGKVSSDELQTLWGKLLAGELKSPGTFSFRLLDFLRNLSRQEALDIAKISSFVIADVIFIGDTKLMDDEGITMGFRLAMQDLGILAGVESMGLQISWGSHTQDRFSRGLISHGRVLVVTHEDPTKKIELMVCQVTSVGRQILRLGRFDAHESYLRRVGRAICEQGFEVQLARFERRTETAGRYFDAEKL